MEKTMTEARADALMEDGFHCSQCVFPYAAFRLGMDRDEALRLSAGLGGGCFHGDSCGAVTGAAMALSIVFGFDRPNAEEADKLLIERVFDYAHAGEIAVIRKYGQLLEERYQEDGIYVKAYIPKDIYARLSF